MTFQTNLDTFFADDEQAAATINGIFWILGCVVTQSRILS